MQMRRCFLLYICFLSCFLLNYEVKAYDTFGLKKHLHFLGSYAVEKVVDGDTILLKNGEYIRLLGLQAPAIDHKNIKRLSSGVFSKKYLENLVLDEVIDLYKASVKRDRYGRILGHLFLKDGRWVQGEMLNAGMAIVYSFADNRKLVSEMLKEEQLAEKDGLGLWAQGFYKVKTHDEAYKYIHGYEIVKGKVLHIGRYKKMFFINFGDDWNKDFTIVISGKVARRFEKSAIDIWEYRGKIISVRGWLKEFKGPTMSISHPEQIKILSK